MMEPVGKCSRCSKEIQCLDGFLNGELQKDKTLLCFECADKERKSERNS